MKKIVIVSPSLDLNVNVSGISSVSDFIIHNNTNYKYIHFQLGKPDKERGFVRRTFRIICSLLKWIRLLRKDEHILVHYNFPLNTFSILRDSIFMWICVVKSIPIVIHIHGGLYLTKQNKPFIIKIILKSIFKWNCPFILLSNQEKKYVIEQYKVKHAFSLPNCIPLDDANKFNRHNSSRLDILFLGRIEPNKGIDYIFDAFNFLKNGNIDFVLHFAGKEEIENMYIPRFQKLLGNHFVYEGVVSGEQKTKLLRQCNVFLLPSFFEGLPMSLLECMSYEMIPITTDVGSIGVYVKDRMNGLIIKKQNAQSIVNAINYLINRNDLMAKMSKNAKQTIFNEFCPSKYIKKLNSIYSMANSHK